MEKIEEKEKSIFYYMFDEMTQQLMNKVKEDNTKAFILLTFEELENGLFSMPVSAAGHATTLAPMILMFIKNNPEVLKLVIENFNKIFIEMNDNENRKIKG